MADIKITVDSSQIRQATKDTAALEKANTKLTAKLDPLIRKEEEFQRTLVQVNKAVQLGVITQRNANKQLIALGAQYGKTAKQVRQMNLALVQGTRSFKRFGSVGLQQVGYQVGDFAVQLQGGTNAFVAFGQQGSQLLGIFGPLGSIAGAVLAIFTAFAAPLSKMETGSGAAADELAKLKGELEPIATMIGNLGSSLKSVSIDAINGIANNLQRVISYAAAFAALWIGRMGIVYGIKAATFAVANFGAVAAGAFKLIRGALISTGIGAIAIALGELINLTLQLREATGSWGQTFLLLKDLLLGALTDVARGMGRFLYETTVGWQLTFASVIPDMLAGLLDYFKLWASQVLALFYRLQQMIGNGFATTFNTVKEVANNVIVFLLQKIDDLTGALASLPGAGRILDATSFAADFGGFELNAINIESPASMFMRAQEKVDSIVYGLRGISNDFEEVNNELKDALNISFEGGSQTVAAWQEIQQVISQGITEMEAFDLQVLLDQMGQTTEETTASTQALDEHIQKWQEYQQKINETLASTELELRQKISLIGLSKEEAELTKFIYDLEKQMGATRSQLNAEQQQQYDTIIALKEEYIQKTKEQEEATKRLEAAEKRVQAVSKTLASETVGALKSIVNGTKTAAEAFRDMALNIIQQIMDILIWQPLIESLTNSISGAISGSSGGGGAMGSIIGSIFGFQNGGAFSAGNVIPFSRGGVVGSPTYFGMSGGRIGLMGEAGPEAILPLKRGAGGKLGVEGGGSVTVNQTFQFAANGDESVKKIIAEAAPRIAKMTEAQIINSRQRGGQMRRAFS